jgi:hypothetical protein
MRSPSLPKTGGHRLMSEWQSRAKYVYSPTEVSSNSRSACFFCLQPIFLRWIHFSKSPGHFIDWNPLDSFVSVHPFNKSLVGHYHMRMTTGIRVYAKSRLSAL